MCTVKAFKVAKVRIGVAAPSFGGSVHFIKIKNSISKGLGHNGGRPKQLWGPWKGIIVGLLAIFPLRGGSFLIIMGILPR